MNVLLIWPPSPEYCILTEEFSCCEPFALEMIAAPLSDECDVDILDLRLDRALDETLGAKSYDVVGLAVPYSVSVDVCNALARRIKRLAPTARLVLGGHYPSVTTDRLWLGGVDYVVRGDAVHTFRELVQALRSGLDCSSIPGVGAVVDGRVYFAARREFRSLDDQPFAARHLTQRHHAAYFHSHYRPVSLVRFSSGCPYQCSFCVLWKMTERRYIVRRNDLVISELSALPNRNIYVVDDEAFIDVKKMHDLASRVIEARLDKRFHMYVRSDTVARNPELFERWAEAGLDSVLVGMESVFEDDLRSYGKAISRDVAKRCMEILHRNRVEVRANFIARPDWTAMHFEKLKDAVVELDVDRPTFSVLTPFVGTDDYEAMKDAFITDRMDLFDCYHSMVATKLPLEQFYHQFAGLFRAAKARGGNGTNVFYAGTDSAFETMVRKMESSYLLYEPGAADVFARRRVGACGT